MSEDLREADEAADPLLVFRVGATWMGVNAFEIGEIIDRQDPLPLPQAPTHIAGMVNLRGRAVPVFDIARYLDLPSTNEQSTSATVFPRTVVVAVDGMRVGIPADEVLGVLPAEDCVLRESNLNMGRIARFVKGELDTPKGITVALDVNQLLDAARVSE